MKLLKRRSSTLARLGIALVIFCSAGLSQHRQARLQGRVLDERGDVIAGARITVGDISGVEREMITDSQGSYVFYGLPVGKLRVSAYAPGFTRFQTEALPKAGHNQLNITLRISISERIEVRAQEHLSLSTDENHLVISGSLLDALPDDPELLASSIAGALGPPGVQGAEIYVDGTQSKKMPSKDLILEIRINRNPFSAEYDQPGLNKIEVFTRPGTEKVHGSAYLNFSPVPLNSRNPFSPHRAEFQSQEFGGSVSGSIIPGKLSNLVSFDRRAVDAESIINATILDPQLNILSYRQAVKTPQHFNSFSLRSDYLLSPSSTISTRYSKLTSNYDRAGLAVFSLPTTAYKAEGAEQSFTSSFLKAFSGKTFNDLRFQFTNTTLGRSGNNFTPTINVLESFLGGGTSVRLSKVEESWWELANNLNLARGKHTLRMGGRFRHVSLTDTSLNNFGGTYVFASGLAPSISPDDHIIQDSTGHAAMIHIPSIERYRRTLQFTRLGLSASLIRQLGGGAAQFSITDGSPANRISQSEFGAYFSDEYHLQPNMSLTLGLRVETQTNIETRLDLAPRVAFVWAPSANNKSRPKTVIRVGSGIFYDRVSENLSLEADRFDGHSQRQFIVSENTEAGRELLDYFPNLPPAHLLEKFGESRTIRRLASRMRSPYMILSGINVDHQLPFHVILTTTYSYRHRLHDLRSRNINAPDADGGRPFLFAGNIFEFQSNATYKQHQLSIQARYSSRKLSLLAGYNWGKAVSDSDGPYSFPASSINLESEFGRSSLDIRHSFFAAANVTGPWGITFSPYVTLRSGAPYNITTGNDTNFDGVLSDRPAFATDLRKPGIKHTLFGVLDPQPEAGQHIVPRNFGSGPGFFQLDLRVSKSIKLTTLGEYFRGFVGLTPKRDGEALAAGTGSGKTAGAPANQGEKKDYKLTFSIYAYNLTNKTNLGQVIGNLSSPLFGRSISTFAGTGPAGSNLSYNRRIELQVRYSF